MKSMLFAAQWDPVVRRLTDLRTLKHAIEVRVGVRWAAALPVQLADRLDLF